MQSNSLARKDVREEALVAEASRLISSRSTLEGWCLVAWELRVGSTAEEGDGMEGRGMAWRPGSRQLSGWVVGVEQTCGDEGGVPLTCKANWHRSTTQLHALAAHLRRLRHCFGAARKAQRQAVLLILRGVSKVELRGTGSGCQHYSRHVELKTTKCEAQLGAAWDPETCNNDSQRSCRLPTCA